MIAFTCKSNEQIVLPTLGVAVGVVKIGRKAVRLRIDAPPESPVLREAAPGLAAERASEGGRPTPRQACERPHARLVRQLCERLETTALGLGVLRLQLDMGMTEEVRAGLDLIQQDFQVLRYGVEGETAEPPAASRPKAGRSPRALLVEDDRNERELLAGFLRLSGLKVDTAGDGSDALDYLRTHDRPDVVLLDMGLPRVDGPATVREIRRNPAFGGLKIFGVTGRLPAEFDLECGPRGIDRWFHKPLDPAALVHDMAEELEGSVCGV